MQDENCTCVGFHTGACYLNTALNITEEDIQNKTPNLEAILADIARELGAEQAVGFDGRMIKLLNEEGGDA